MINRIDPWGLPRFHSDADRADSDKRRSGLACSAQISRVGPEAQGHHGRKCCGIFVLIHHSGLSLIISEVRHTATEAPRIRHLRSSLLLHPACCMAGGFVRISKREQKGLHGGLINGLPDRDRRAVLRSVASRLNPVSTQREKEADVVY